ncbi:conserved hypothetical protein [Ricinus communis]|uniref:Uncharacterized protein n=1 Tax=Ricinus communis TaxID=3988 RepID=B9SP77_RICCO|nr:conserved hypothetical protein [Ricinus communis]
MATLCCLEKRSDMNVGTQTTFVMFKFGEKFDSSSMSMLSMSYITSCGDVRVAVGGGTDSGGETVEDVEDGGGRVGTNSGGDEGH